MSAPTANNPDEAHHARSIIDDNGEFKKVFDEWYFQTDGSNLLRVLG
jgi:hypothetical protein